MIDITFDKMTINLLNGLIGAMFESYACDPFEFSPSVFGVVGFKIENRYYQLTCNLEKIDRFWREDEVAMLRFDKCGDHMPASRMDGGAMINTPVYDTIIQIDLINDLESVSFKNEKRSICSTKGIIFHLLSGNEISFEVDTWFSEMITIQRGYNLIDKFTPVDDFLEEWEGCEGYTTSVERKIISLKQPS